MIRQARISQRFAGRPLANTFVASAMIQGLNVVTGVVLARQLGPHGRGELAAILLWTMLVCAVGSLGFPEALTYETAAERRSARRAFGTSVGASLVLSVVLVIVGAAVLKFTLADYDSAVQTSGYLLLAVVPLYLITNLCAAALQGLEAFGVFNLIRTMVPGATALCLVGVAVTEGLGVRTAVLSYVAAYLATTVGGLIVLRRTPLWGFEVERSMLRRMLNYGLRSQSTLVTSALVERLDQLLISLVLGATSLGLYTVAVTLTSATTIAASTVALVAFPQVAALSKGRVRVAAVKRFLLLAVAASGLITIPIFIATPQLLSLFFGAAFEPVANSCRVLLIAGVFLGAAQLMVALLRGLGRPLDAGFAGGVGLAVTAVLLAVLLPTFGLMGAAAASLVSYAVMAWWLLWKVCSALQLSISQFLLGGHRGTALEEIA